jgi:hypothetical protein
MANRDTQKARLDGQEIAGFRMSDDEWDRLQKHGAFIMFPSQLVRLRERIDVLTNCYCLAVTSGLTSAEWRNADLKILRLLEKTEVAVGELKTFTTVRDGLSIPEIFGNGFEVQNLDMGRFEAVGQLKADLTQYLSDLPKPNRGPKPSFVMQLVRGIMHEINTLDDSKHFSRSTKHRSVPKGHEETVSDYASGDLNDIKFFELLFELTEKITKAKIDTGTITQAIKDVVTQDNWARSIEQEFYSGLNNRDAE